MFRSGILALFLVLSNAFFPPSGVSAQDSAPAGQVLADTRTARAKLEGFKIELDQLEAGLRRSDLQGNDLQAMRQRVDPLMDGVRDLAGELDPRIESAKTRIEQLGPKPKDDQPLESPDLTRERVERGTALSELEDSQRLARTLLVQSEQIVTEISDRRRTAFARALFERNASLASPELWSSVVGALPRDAAALGMLLTDWIASAARQTSFKTLIPLVLALGTAGALYLGRNRLATRLVTRNPSISEPSRRKKVLAAVGMLAIGAAPAAIGSLVVLLVLNSVGLLPTRVSPVIQTFLIGIAFIAFIHALADALAAPGRAPWRLVSLTEPAARRIVSYATLLATFVVVGRVVERLSSAIAAAFPINLVTRAFFAIAAAAVIAGLLQRFSPTTTEEESCLGPYVPTESPLAGPLRLAGWAATGLIIVSAGLGYVAFASFLVDQILWIGMLGALLILGIILADELIAGALSSQNRFSTVLQANTGLRRRSLDQIAVLGSGLSRVILVGLIGILALAPWGVESADLLSSARAVLFGFKVGDVTISLSAILIAITLFALGFAATRAVKTWLDATFLPATELDPGLRNSISTAFGYMGIVIAAAIAFSYLGLGIDRLTIVAGALSVGIGFGLQSIVNNFVSGLILLWERPIRVGDLIVAGDGEGHVRRINVRSTEIETFDRSTIIVPNSNLISGVVRNRVRNDRTGRVIVSVGVARSNDPDKVVSLLTHCATAHADILNEPAPKVFLKRIGDILDYDLICYVPDVEVQARVSSDLHFAIFRCLSEQNLLPPLGMPALDVHGLDPLQQALTQIAGAIDKNVREARATGKSQGAA